MKVGAIIVCRLDSKRLPGKTLRKALGKPLLWYVIRKCTRVALDSVIVATSDRPVDDPIADYCKGLLGINVFRGAADDVAHRVLECARTHEMDYFLRVNGDSPFFDAGLASQAIGIIRRSDYDLVTNLCPRSFPYGVSVELIKTDSFQSAYKRMTSPEHFEHVTLHFYDHITKYRFFNISNDGPDLSSIRMTVDTPEDFERFERFLHVSGRPWGSSSYIEVLESYR